MHEAVWNEEELFLEGGEFFKTLEKYLNSAQKTVTVEMYIFESDIVGKRILSALGNCAKRGVRTRVIVDSIGSLNSKPFIRDYCQAHGIGFQVYHELPWERARDSTSGAQRKRFARLLWSLNKRNHRKLIVVDDTHVFAGGMNIWDVHLRSIRGDEAWRDTGIRVSGPEVTEFSNSFERLWHRRNFRANIQGRLQMRRAEHSRIARLNDTRRLRRLNFQQLVSKISNAKHRIWITTPYFVPNKPLLERLKSAAERGVDVRILVGRISDIVFMPWIAEALAHPLLKSGAKVFEYLPRMLHAKVCIIDDWMTVGSSNLNHRSLVHDLESDVVITQAQTAKNLIAAFELDLELSEEIRGDKSGATGLWKRMLARIILCFRNYL